MAHDWSRDTVVLNNYAYSPSILSEEHRLYKMMCNLLWLGLEFTITGEFETLDCFSY